MSFRLKNAYINKECRAVMRRVLMEHQELKVMNTVQITGVEKKAKQISERKPVMEASGLRNR